MSIRYDTRVYCALKCWVWSV